MENEELPAKGVLSDESLLKMTDGLIRDANAFIGQKIQDDRARALDYYNSKPYGNEVEGRSKARSTDVRSTIEWIKPALMRQLYGGDSVVSIQGQGDEDQENAKIAEEWVNYVIQRINPGFMIVLTWISDALLQKNGFITCQWSEETEIKEEIYEEISKEALDELENMDNYETTFIEEVEVAVPVMVDQLRSEVVIEKRYNVKANRKMTRGDIIIDAVPPEELLTLEDTKSVKDSRFWCHFRQMPLSDVRELGYDIPDEVTSDPLPAMATDDDEEFMARDYSDASDWAFNDDDQSAQNLDPSMKLIWFYRMWMKADDDGDGIAEWIQVDRIANRILSRTRISRPPLHSICPIPLPHKFFGLSYAEIIAPLEDIKTALWRQVLNYLYYTINPRAEIAAEGASEYTVSDWLNNRPNGMIRTEKPGTVTPFHPPQLQQGVFSMFEVVDQDLETRAGVSRHQQGLDPDTLNKTAAGMAMSINEGAQRVDLIARVFAETGFKDLAQHIIELSVDYPEMVGQRILRLTNGKQLTVTADAVKGSYDFVVSVGLGAANKANMLTHAQLLMQVQQMMIQAGAGPGSPTQMVAWENLFNTVREMLRTMGLRNVDDFFTDPESDRFRENPPPEPQLPPEAMAAQIEAQWRMASIKQQEQEALLDAKTRQRELDVKAQEIELKKLELQQKGIDIGSKVGERAVNSAVKLGGAG